MTFFQSGLTQAEFRKLQSGLKLSPRNRQFVVKGFLLNGLKFQAGMKSVIASDAKAVLTNRMSLVL